MTTLAKRTANQRNAQHSTGPKTDIGKAVARMNAVAHGLRAASPVVPGQDPNVCEAYRNEVVSDLAPVGMLEAELADRVARQSWRLRQVIAFEAGAITRNSQKAARRVLSNTLDCGSCPKGGAPRRSICIPGQDDRPRSVRGDRGVYASVGRSTGG
jgi:hypothetical protein